MDGLGFKLLFLVRIHVNGFGVVLHCWRTDAIVFYIVLGMSVDLLEM